MGRIATGLITEIDQSIKKVSVTSKLKSQFLSVCRTLWFSIPNQRSARVSKKSRSRQLLPSLGKSRSRKTLNCSLGKVSVSRDLKICSLEKSRSRRNRKFESRKSLGLDNFHWIVSEITKFRKTDSKGGLWQLYSSLNLNFVPRNHDTIPYPCNLIHIIPK